MTATIVENDQSLFESLDLGFAQQFACEGLINGADCPAGAPAVWRMRMACCPRTYLLCEDCLFTCLEIMRNYRDEHATCASCGESFIIDPSIIIVLGRVK